MPTPKARPNPVDSLTPKMGEFPVSNSAFYQRLFLTDTADPDPGAARALVQPIDPFDGQAGVSRFSTRPATGVLLTFEQGWYLDGLGLGELRHSLCLAPGEVTKLAVMDWRRTTRDASASQDAQTEAVAAETADRQASAEVQNAVARETSQSSSSTASMGSQTEVGGSVSGLFVSMSGSASTSNQLGFAATASTGSRDLGASAAQQIDQRTQQLCQSTRSRRSTQIRELSESERQSASTRVVANYNHMHAMTVQYFEVLQSYSLATKVVAAERCVFVPVQVMDFGPDTMARPGVLEAVRRVVTELRWTEAVTGLERYVSDRPRAAHRLDTAATDLDDARERVAMLTRAVREQQQHLEERMRGRAEGAPVVDPAADRLRDKQLHDASLQPGQDGSPSAAADPRLVELTDRLTEQTARVVDAERAVTEARSDLAEIDRVLSLLQEHRLLVSQQLWMRVDEYTWHLLVADATYPDPPYEGEHLGSLVVPTPIGYFGNYVAFRWDFPATKKGTAAAAEFTAAYTDTVAVSSRVVLPTEGVFAEAVLGRSNSAEKLDVTRFWNWQDSPIPILPPEMAPMELGSRARDVTVTPVQLETAVARLQDLKLDPLGSLTTESLAALKTALFPDSGTVAAASAGAQTAGANAAAGATTAIRTTVDLTKNAQDFVVGLANSEVGKIAAQAVASNSGGISSVGGLINSARDGAGGTGGGAAGAPGAGEAAGGEAAGGEAAGAVEKAIAAVAEDAPALVV